MSVVIDPHQTGWVVLPGAVDLACEVLRLQYEPTIRRIKHKQAAGHYLYSRPPHFITLGYRGKHFEYDEASETLWHELAHARQREQRDLGLQFAQRDELREVLLWMIKPHLRSREYPQWEKKYFLSCPAEREAQNLALIYNKKLKLTAPV